MGSKKQGRRFASCARSQFAFPYENAINPTTGAFEPMFRLKYAKILAAEQKGHFDEKRGVFLIPSEDGERIVSPVRVRLSGVDTNLYPIGPDWNWSDTGDAKIYGVFWGDAFFVQGNFHVADDFFTEDRCYTREEIEQIVDLPVGALWYSHDYGSQHTAVRIK
jgi:hypothetical protein